MGNYPSKPYKRKRNYPVKKKRSNQQRTPNNHMPKVFSNNLVNTNNFGRNAREVRGYVMREVIVRDKYGNEKVMREKQFFVAGQHPGNMMIDD